MTLGGDGSMRQAETIRRFNDAFRRGLPRTDARHRLVVTAGLASLTIEQFADLMEAVSEFDRFTPDNDPHGEHDFGAIDFEGERYFWTISYHDTSFSYGSPDPADPSVTCRVLTLMLTSEY